MQFDPSDLPRLNDLNQPPETLYYKGSFESLRRPCVAIVGARACSTYGRTVARHLGRAFAEANVTVVSGLARGIDAEAHRGALDVGGRTVAVFGCGIDRIYPAAHGELAKHILFHNGMHVSEYEAGVEAAPWRFPARNRIIAALSHIVIVVEARERSGALICADFALEAGRRLFAVPGEITAETSVGPNRLIADGHAAMISSISSLDVGEIVDHAMNYPVRKRPTFGHQLDPDTVARHLGRDTPWRATNN
jgi:DNA processing protein